jgi:hypothetical protein
MALLSYTSTLVEQELTMVRKLTPIQQAQLQLFMVAILVARHEATIGNTSRSYIGCSQVSARTAIEAEQRAREHALLRWNKNGDRYLITECVVYPVDQVPRLSTDREGEPCIAAFAFGPDPHPPYELVMFEFSYPERGNQSREIVQMFNQVQKLFSTRYPSATWRAASCQPKEKYQKLTARYD